jgi:hypothetical protein
LDSVGGGRPAFDELESLELNLSADGPTNHLAHSQSPVSEIYGAFFRSAPKLTDVLFDTTFFQEGLLGNEAVVPWTRLEHLTIETDTISTCRVLEICSLARNLKALSVRKVAEHNSSEIDSANPQNFEAASVALPHLHSMKVTLCCELHHLLEPLALGPQMRNLDVNVILPTERLLEEVLRPLDQLIERIPPAPLRGGLDVRCGIHQPSVLPDVSASPAATPLDEVWMLDKGLKCLAGQRWAVVVSRPHHVIASLDYE